MPYTDLRDFLKQIDGLGELRLVRGADWNVEIGAITDLTQHQINGPAVLLDDIKGYRSGFRVVSKRDYLRPILYGSINSPSQGRSRDSQVI